MVWYRSGAMLGMFSRMYLRYSYGSVSYTHLDVYKRQPFAPLYALQFIFRKINLYIRNINPIYALIYIFRGIKDYKNIHKD